MRVKIIAIVSLVVLFMLVGLFVYLFEPYVVLDRDRVSTIPIYVDTIYVNVTGEPGCAKLYRLNNTDDQNSVITQIPVFVYLPEGLPSPEDGNYAYSNNKFTLKGYEYKWVKKNVITGKKVEYPAARFDVLSWRLHTPYKVWTSLAYSEKPPLVKISTEPVEHTYNSSDHPPTIFIGQNSIDCLK